MPIKINKNLCNGCGKRKESKCMMVCPGNLLYKDDDNKAVIRDKRDCWDCAACVKECPQQAIELYLPVEIGGRGSTLTAKVYKNKIVWTIHKVEGDIEKFEIQNKSRFNLNL